MRKIIAVVLLLMISPVIFAQTIDGAWNASIETPQGPSPILFDFAVSGSAVSGSMSNAFMGTNAISEGMLTGKNVSFKIVVDGGAAGEMIINYRGTVNGNTLNLLSTFEGATPPGTPQEQSLIAKRVN